MGGCVSLKGRVHTTANGLPEYRGVMKTDGGDMVPQPDDGRPALCDDPNAVRPLTPSSDDPDLPNLTILHFNDSHNLVPPKLTDPIGGAARFATVVKEYRAKKDCLVLFSGDVFNPSRLSTVTKGKHVGPVLKALRPHCGVYGNHDFDFGVEELVKLAAACELPWVMTNVVDTSGAKPVPVANSQRHYLFTHRGINVGIIGIVEKEWLDTIRDLPPWVQYNDKVACAKEEIRILKAQGAHVIIALTHMREYNDRAFLENVPEVDLLLGGHDHYYLVADVNGTKLIKSSADFVNTTFVELWVPTATNGIEPGRIRVETTRIPIMSSIEEDPEIKSILESHDKDLAVKLNKDLCRLTRELDVMCETVRTQESAAGNWIADIMREEMSCDLAIVNSGVMRANLVYLPGVLKLKDILDILPMEDIVVSLLVSGSCLRDALECGLSKFPALEGRFPQISGMRVLFDPSARPLERVRDVLVNGKALLPTKLYKVATTSYLSSGGDGYIPFREDPKYIVEIENGRILPTMVRQFLTDLPGKHRNQERQQSLASVKEDTRLGQFERQHSVSEIKRAFLPNVNPRVEGRIIVSTEFMSFKAMGGKVSSPSLQSIHSESSMHLLVPRSPNNRRTSMAHPIHIKRTMGNLTDVEYAHEAQEAETMQWDAPNPDGASYCRPSSGVEYLQPHNELPRSISSHTTASHPVHAKALHGPGKAADAAHRASADCFRFPAHGPEMQRVNSSSSCTTIRSDHLRPLSVQPNIYDVAAKGDLDGLQAIMRNTKVLLNRKGVPNLLGLDQLKANGLGSFAKEVGTPLHFAIAFGHIKAVDYLLDQGADTRECTQMGGNARELAYAHLVMAHNKGNAALVKSMEAILGVLKHHEENMTEEQRFMAYR